MQLHNSGNNSSGLTSPVPPIGPGSAASGAGDGSANGGAGGSSSAAVSPAIAVSPPIGSNHSASTNNAGTPSSSVAAPAGPLSFSASSLAGSAVSGASSTGNNGVTSESGGAGQILADCDPARLAALSSYPRLGAAAGGLSSMYSAASYPSTDQNPYPSIAVENSFYGALVSHASASFFRISSSLALIRRPEKSYKCDSFYVVLNNSSGLKFYFYTQRVCRLSGSSLNSRVVHLIEAKAVARSRVVLVDIVYHIAGIVFYK